MYQCYVIKQMVITTAYTIELWMHLGGLLSFQEAKVALLCNLSRQNISVFNLEITENSSYLLGIPRKLVLH